MKTIAAITVILAGTFAFGAAFPVAGEDNPAATRTGKDVPNRVKPHSHVQEKTGVPQTQPVIDRIAGRPNPWTDYSRHFHPRDR